MTSSRQHASADLSQRPRHRERQQNTAISGRSSGSRIILPAAPSQPGESVHSHQSPGQWHPAAIVPEYSGGSTVDSHHLPFSSPLGDTAHRDLFGCQCGFSRRPKKYHNADRAVKRTSSPRNTPSMVSARLAIAKSTFLKNICSGWGVANNNDRASPSHVAWDLPRLPRGDLR